MIPKKVVDYIKNKKLTKGFSYKDVWHEEHAINFTVAKAMQMDVLKDINQAVLKATEEGWTLDHFRKNLEPTLRKKGWWGKKEMLDPVTGKTVNAQLGSARRLETIYNTNIRSAYQQQRWESSQASEAHPYLMYRVTPQKNNREEHLAWNGLVLPKDDPWWKNHFPIREFNCKCTTMAITEARKQRLEKDGIKVPPTHDGQQGYTIPIKTEAPPETYNNFYNERKGIVERVPVGVNPAFNWNHDQIRRDVPIMQKVLRTTSETIPEQYDAVAKTLMNNKVFINEYQGFVEKALNRTISTNKAHPVGFLDQQTVKYLKNLKNKNGINIGINLTDNNVIVLDAKLLTAKKFSGRHTVQGNAPSDNDWKNLVEYLFDAQIFLDERKSKSLIFLRQLSEVKYIKIAVDINIENNFKPLGGVKPLLPKIDSMYTLDISTESNRGNDTLTDILKLKKIR